MKPFCVKRYVGFASWGVAPNFMYIIGPDSNVSSALSVRLLLSVGSALHRFIALYLRCCSFRFSPALYSGFSFFRPPPGFLALYALFSPIIIRAAPAAVHPGHGRMSSSCRCNHPHGLAHSKPHMTKVACFQTL